MIDYEVNGLLFVLALGAMLTAALIIAVCTWLYYRRQDKRKVRK
jgi:hypothetical protein